jgi:hypothetical protein
MSREIIPLINGSKWARETIPDVIDIIAKNSKLSRKEQRILLEKRFQRFYRKTSDGWETYQGDLLRTEEQFRHHLYWTWIDQFALPTCKHFMMIISTKYNYALSSQGKRLAEKLGKPGFQDMLRHVVINVDREKWGVLDILHKTPLDVVTLREKLERTDVRVRKDEHLRKFLSFLQEIGLVNERPPSFYQLDEARYERCRRLLRYRSCDDVDDVEFVRVLYKQWDNEQRRSHSSFVDIDELRASVSRALKVPESCFNEKLKKVPLRVGQFQLLFSQAAFPRENVGIERKGRYFNYVSIYQRKGGGAKP